MRPSTKRLIAALHDLVAETRTVLSAAPFDTLEVEAVSQTGSNLEVIEHLVNVISDNEEIYYA